MNERLICDLREKWGVALRFGKWALWITWRHWSCKSSWHLIEKLLKFLIPYYLCNISQRIPLAIGAKLHYTQRGGDITYHGPHQAILYLIISLRDIGFGARKYVEKLELTMIELASMYGVKAQTGQRCETGVWVDNRKIGAIGVRISSGITSHGLAFNVDPDLSYFKHIVPCGIVQIKTLRRWKKWQI